jgi:hypothetical protein
LRPRLSNTGDSKYIGLNKSVTAPPLDLSEAAVDEQLDAGNVACFGIDHLSVHFNPAHVIC